MTVQYLAGVRVDSWIERGTTISPHYDSLLAKLMVFAPDRAAATKKMSAALAETQVRPCCADNRPPVAQRSAAQRSAAQRSTAQHSTACRIHAVLLALYHFLHPSVQAAYQCLLAAWQDLLPTQKVYSQALSGPLRPFHWVLTLKLWAGLSKCSSRPGSQCRSGRESRCMCLTLPKSCGSVPNQRV